MQEQKTSKTKYHIAFFGTPEPAVEILDALNKAGLSPELIITNPDKPQGRNLLVTPTPVKLWAEKNNIEVFQPETLDQKAEQKLQEQQWDLFIVVAYGKIIPKAILDIAKHGSINVHYSRLPKYRGASPIETQILEDDKNPGISIMLLDEKMDHGPLLGTSLIKILEQEWPISATELRKRSNYIAGDLLTKLIPEFIAGKITLQEQDHTQATYTKKFTKQDTLLNLEEDAYQNYLKIQAFSEWSPTYFFVEKNGKKIRVIIKKASYNKQENKLVIERIIPEGKKEMNYSDFIDSVK